MAKLELGECPQRDLRSLRLAVPRAIDAEQAEGLIEGWQEAGGDPRNSPFEPSTDVGWFYRELMKDVRGLEASSDAVPNKSSTPIWLSTTDEPPARVVGIRLSPGLPADALDTILELATKYDLVLLTPEAAASASRSRRWPPTPAGRSGRPERFRRRSRAPSAA
jgi:hypothetical protein